MTDPSLGCVSSPLGRGFKKSRTREESGNQGRKQKALLTGQKCPKGHRQEEDPSSRIWSFKINRIIQKGAEANRLGQNYPTGTRQTGENMKESGYIRRPTQGLLEGPLTKQLSRIGQQLLIGRGRNIDCSSSGAATGVTAQN